MPPRYTPLEECRTEVRDYIRHLDAGTDNNDPDKRQERSTLRYKQDIRWFNDWLDEQGIDSVLDVTVNDTRELGYSLSEAFNGTTSRYRWDRIHAFYDWLERIEITNSNPLDRWNEDKKSMFGLAKTTEQSKQLREGETYAVDQDDIRVMEENVGRPRVRNQLLIRLLWQTGLRRGEVSSLKLRDLNRDDREITVRASNAKNNLKRIVAYQPSLDSLLRKWLDRGKRDAYNTDDLPYLFIGERGAQLSGSAINEAVRKAAINAGINRKLDYEDANSGSRWLITAHNVRHGFGTYLVHETDAGLYEISKQMGHSSVDITEDIYVSDDPRAGIDQTRKYGPD